EVEGEVLFDAASRGRYATDASIYQVMPVGVVVPKTPEAARIAVQIAVEAGVPVLSRGGGTSQCGQTVGAALVIDHSKYLNQVVSIDAEARRAAVQPGLVLDHLNAQLKAHGRWYPVDVSTSAQATLGGMAGNNSCGSRSIAYGNMVHNVAGIDMLMADGRRLRFAEEGDCTDRDLVARIRAICEREAAEITARFPPLLRRVAGYNLDLFNPRDPLHYNSARPNLAHLLVGSEGTLGVFQSLDLKLSPLPAHRVLGVVNVPTFYRAMEVTRHIVGLTPTAVELVDRTMIDLSRENPLFRPVIDAALIGEPEALLLVEFAGGERTALEAKLADLEALLGDHGLPGAVVKLTDAGAQKKLWEVRKAGLNIMMSMKGDGKPVSFIEDCCVPLEHLAEYTRRLTEVFTKHGTKGTWYAHASVGTLHVRPVLDMRREGATQMRAIAEEAAELVREYKGVYSGEHGDGLVRSEWIAPFFGPRLTAALGEIKTLFDPNNLMNPGKIVSPPKQDDRTLFRFAPGYATQEIRTGLDWSKELGMAGAVEMCNNNGHCRKFDAGTMCPSYRATGDEQHLTRGRANTLRLALSNQLGPAGIASEDVREALELCVGCKGCKRECPTGVDMAKMKIEATYQYKRAHGFTLKDKLIAYLPRYARYAPLFAWAVMLRNALPGAALLTEGLTGFSARRRLPQWRRGLLASVGAGKWQAAMRKARAEASEAYFGPERDVVLFTDTFTNYFEAPTKLFPGVSVEAAAIVLQRAGYNVDLIGAATGERPLCCGRTFLAGGLVDEARAEAKRTLDALLPYAKRGVPIIGLEPSCLTTLRDEFLSLLPGPDAELLAGQSFLFEEFLAREQHAGRLDPARLNLRPLPLDGVRVHGHCHQKAFDAFEPVIEVLRWIPELKVEPIESSCCGMAGSFGYDAKHHAVSMKMAELALLPAVREASDKTLIVAGGTSCRTQILDGAQRNAVHPAIVLAASMVTIG
ncbi:MAG: FAD-binding protein, partial [Betaproteobacteria bacterium]|nr:FAD-binding protein [Betaproteobacteria bacterium]